MSKKTKNYFLTNDDIYRDMVEWHDSCEDIGGRVISERMGEDMLKLSTHLLQHPRFVRYPQWMKDEMRQEGVLKIMKNLKNIRYEENRKSLFCYWTRCAWTAYITYLGQYYKEKNLKRDMTLKALNEVQQGEMGIQVSPNVVKHLTQLLEEFDSTNSELLIED